MPMVSPDFFKEKMLGSTEILSLLSHDDNAKLKIFTTESNNMSRSINVCLTDLESGRMIFPDFNQKITWDKAHMDSFVEASLLKMPVPNITVVTDKLRNLFVVIDGYQRLMTLALYTERLPEKYLNEQTQKLMGFSLNGISQNSKWYGKSYKELNVFDRKTLTDTYTINFNEVYLDNSESFDFAYYMYRKLSSSSYCADDNSN